MRATVRIALFAAMTAALGFLLAPVPNVELVTFCLFAGGALLGPRAGCAAALLAVTLYFGLNPYGSSLAFPLLFLAQGLAGLLIALLGALYARLFPIRTGSAWLRRGALLLFAAPAALCLPLLPSLVFMWQGGGAWQGWMALGLAMTLGSLLVNLVIFLSSYEALMRQAARLEAGAHA